MLSKVIRAETLKLQHSPVWLAFFLLPLLPAVMGTFNYLQNIEILQDEWYSLWSQQTLFFCYFFFPALIGVYCSYLMRLEYGNHNWNSLLAAPVSYSSIYLAKLYVASVMVLFTQVWIGFLFVISGKLMGLESPIPAEILLWLFCGAAGGIVVCALQLCISLVIRSFAVPVAIGLLGGIVGLFANAKDFGSWFPYSLLSLGMSANYTGEEMSISLAQFLLHCGLFLFLFCLVGISWLRARDVSA